MMVNRQSRGNGVDTVENLKALWKATRRPTLGTWHPSLSIPTRIPCKWRTAAAAAGKHHQRVAQAAANCTVTASSDCDGDGLSDQVEIYQLGTLVDVIDTDGDKIADKAEIQPMIVGGETWYLDPLSSDSNGDGLADLDGV
ncbi:MAG: hypothetical protein R2932_60180 [Caldilineaceae bacterium]